MADKLNAAAWQQKLDHEFPQGVVMSWAGQEWTYLVPWVQVTSMRGLNPVLYWMTDGMERSFGPWPLESYNVFQEKPHLLVRVTLGGDNISPMVWSASVPEQAAKVMAKTRAEVRSKAITPA